MAKVECKAYASSHIVLLAFNWEEGKTNAEFIGFAVKRTPGFSGQSESWLRNLLSFEGPVKKLDENCRTDRNPIQKFMWWDADIDDKHEGMTFIYTVYPVLYQNNSCVLVTNDSAEIKVKIPSHQSSDKKITTYFNRAVVSSQAFSKRFCKDGKFIESKKSEAYKWLANGLNDAFSEIMKDATSIDGAVYHIRDEEWIVPTFEKFNGRISLLVDYHEYTRNTKDGKHKAGDIKDDGNEHAKEVLRKALSSSIEFPTRTKTNIMHNKFLVHFDGKAPKKLMMGSANFTTGALTSQANLLHIFDSPELAELYQERKAMLEGDPTLPETAKEAGWSKTVKVGDAEVRVFFSPEKKDGRLALDPVLKAIEGAKKSVVFCIFTPTDKEIRDAIFKKGDEGKMMFGMVNSISQNEPKDGKPTKSGAPRADVEAKIDLYHRSKNNKDTYSHRAFGYKNTPLGFWNEISGISKKNLVKTDDDGDAGEPVKSTGAPEVYIHHKFIVIDAETDNPIIFTGSANFSGNSCYHNDENMLEIKGAPEVAKIYLVEFLRLYEHYRARTQFTENKNGKTPGANNSNNGKKNKTKNPDLVLQKDYKWASKYYKAGSPEYKSRLNMVQ